jgi:putative phosphoribosyl transferase
VSGERQSVCFADRREAGRALADRLAALNLPLPRVVLALPRGGVPVAAEVARALHAPLDLLLVRKIGAPGNPELGMGAVAEGGVCVVDDELVGDLGVGAQELEAAVARARAELAEGGARYRPGGSAPAVAGRTVIVIDDGLATGGTATAAVHALRDRGAGRIVVAVPVAAPESAARLRELADEVVCVQEPPQLRGVGAWYEDFSPTTDDEVRGLLAQARGADGGPVRIPVAGGAAIEADLVVPPGARGLVIFAHGSGSSRHSSRNRHVAEVLQRSGLGTLLLDLLTPDEERDRRNVFDIALLAARLDAATAWAADQPATSALPVGYFGASTGGGAALVAAAQPGGRPDLAGPWLGAVRAPVLLIVGGDDHAVLDLNRQAAAELRASCELAVVPGATHLFEEPGALDEVARLAADWFTRHLAPAGAR